VGIHAASESQLTPWTERVLAASTAEDALETRPS